MSTVIKVLHGTAETKTGKVIPISKVLKFKPGHPDYEKEVALKKDFESKRIMSVNPHKQK